MICEISYCEVPCARVYPHDDEDDSVVTETITSDTMTGFNFAKLSELVQQRDESKKRPKFKRAEIYFPLPILQVFKLYYMYYLDQINRFLNFYRT